MMCVSPSVVCDRLITNGSGSGDPALQGLARERWLGSSQVSTRAGERVSRAIVRAIQRSRGTGPRATVKKTARHRRARACPSPAFALRKKRLLFSSGP